MWNLVLLLCIIGRWRCYIDITRQLLFRQVTSVIVLHYLSRVALWAFRDGTTFPQQRALDDFPSFQSPVFLFEFAVEIWEEEYAVQDDNPERNPKNAAKHLAGRPFVKLQGWSCNGVSRENILWSDRGLLHTSLPDDDHC